MSFLRLRTKGDKSKKAIKKKAKKRRMANIRICDFVKSLLLLFRKYKVKVTPAEDITIARRRINQYVVANEIKTKKF